MSVKPDEPAEVRRGATTTFELDAIDVESIERAGIAEREASASPRSVAAVLAVVAGIVGVLLIVLQALFTFVVALVAAGVLLVAALGIYRRRRDRNAALPRSRFVVRVDPGTMSIESGGRRTIVELAEIARFEAMLTALVLVRRNGARDTLPFRLVGRTNNEALAARLEAAVTEARMGGGYRGTEPDEDAPGRRAAR